ncbi:LysR family transcriptional regulator [Silicimonas sp. MF1-12-2]|uniref:LysR family transcriptional regulator n=1 Tax=Silicimonas sp. MF1-12-2 TaxID=3384793 RepID=UPI0039B5935B
MANNRALVRDPRLLRSLQYFESVARHGSVKAAADEFNVSPSAISHQLRELKSYLGEEVLAKSGRGIRLTETGEQLFQHVSGMLANLDRVIENTVGKSKPLVRLAVCSSLGPTWLAKRLPEFLDRESSVDVELRLYASDPLQTDTIADIVITAGEVEEGFTSSTLFEEMLIAVGSPTMPRGGNGMPLRLITTDLDPGSLAEDWRDFSDVSGVDYAGSVDGRLVRCTHYLLAMGLAETGVGAALVPDFLVADALERGDLVQIDPAELPAGRFYKLCYKLSRERDPVIRGLARWLEAQVRFVGIAAQ